MQKQVREFQRTYTSQMWLQHIGSQEHEVPNIYLQNQEHIAAIEYYLKSKGLMHDFGTCHNMLLSNSHMSLELSGSAANFYYGDIDFLKKNIQETCTKASARSGEDAEGTGGEKKSLQRVSIVIINLTAILLLMSNSIRESC